MDFGAIYHFLFETFGGIAVLIGAGIVISIIACAIMEWRTRRTFVDRGPKPEDEDDEWSFFDDDDEDE